MNKELEEDVKEIKKFIEHLENDTASDFVNFTSNEDIQRLKNILQALENSIPKEKIEKLINDDGFEVHTKDYGNIDVLAIDNIQELLEGKYDNKRRD